MSFVYFQSERGEHPVYTVGHYDPDDSEWIPESDHPTAESAAARCNYLNGGTDPVLLKQLREIFDSLEGIRTGDDEHTLGN